MPRNVEMVLDEASRLYDQAEREEDPITALELYDEADRKIRFARRIIDRGRRVLRIAHASEIADHYDVDEAMVKPS